MSQNGQHEHLFTVQEVAARLRVDEATIRRWIENNVLDAVVLPHAGKRKAYRIKATTIESIMNPTKE